MAIKFVCSECEEDVKVKDDLAGRKIKCPNCGERTRVPDLDEDEEEEPRRPAKKSRRPDDDEEEDTDEERRPAKKSRRSDDDDTEEEDDRPRKRTKDKKGKKPQKSKTVLIVGLAIGGGVLVIGAVVGLVLMLGGGSGKGGPGPNPPGPGGGPAATGPSLNPKLIQEWRMIGMAYHDYYDRYRKGPSNALELQPLIGPPAAKAHLLSPQYVFIYGVKPLDMLQGTSNTILAYDKDTPTRGGLVLLGDGAVMSMSAAEFQNAPKAQPRGGNVSPKK